MKTALVKWVVGLTGNNKHTAMFKSTWGRMLPLTLIQLRRWQKKEHLFLERELTFAHLHSPKKCSLPWCR